jgi:hypothetical protein
MNGFTINFGFQIGRHGMKMGSLLKRTFGEVWKAPIPTLDTSARSDYDFSGSHGRGLFVLDCKILVGSTV